MHITLPPNAQLHPEQQLRCRADKVVLCFGHQRLADAWAPGGTCGGILLQVVDINSSERYQWGSASEGWHLLNRPELSVIQERVPPGDRERRHFHSNARQFFYVLEGQAVLEVGGSRFEVGAGQGLEVPPGVPHQFMNESPNAVTFLVVSCPHSHGDRTNV